MKILVNFPTNLGDAILALPVLDRLRANFPSAKIVAICSLRIKDFLSRHSFIDEVIIFDKRWPIREKIRFTLSLRAKFELVIDLKNSFLPFLIGGRRLAAIRLFGAYEHAKDRYLKLIKRIAPLEASLKAEFFLKPQERKHWQELNIEKALFIACFSRSSLKVYPEEYLKGLLQHLRKDFKLIILGESSEAAIEREGVLENGILNLVGKTSFLDVYYLLKNYAQGLVCVDTSILHLASYLDLPIVALFGPTDERIYGPWSKRFIVLRKKLSCAPCAKAQCVFNNECMQIEPLRVIEAVKKLIGDEGAF